MPNNGFFKLYLRIIGYFKGLAIIGESRNQDHNEIGIIWIGNPDFIERKLFCFVSFQHSTWYRSSGRISWVSLCHRSCLLRTYILLKRQSLDNVAISKCRVRAECKRTLNSRAVIIAMIGMSPKLSAVFY